ncbi:uncharacterized protein LOC129628937 isoform X2 [Bubalus kerabau]|uniref:uncharacterized protein LOC129628937 isoform X2 n=1 Tax=Bubalus carabanensis TaxID=3119969 RepID=UPI00244E7E38|nr:uncharacterized protein LOC129628937 isoform X2 [Bubalus carabanensis]
MSVPLSASWEAHSKMGDCQCQADREWGTRYTCWEHGSQGQHLRGSRSGWGGKLNSEAAATLARSSEGLVTWRRHGQKQGAACMLWLMASFRLQSQRWLVESFSCCIPLVILDHLGGSNEDPAEDPQLTSAKSLLACKLVFPLRFPSAADGVPHLTICSSHCLPSHLWNRALITLPTCSRTFHDSYYDGIKSKLAALASNPSKTCFTIVS